MMTLALEDNLDSVDCVEKKILISAQSSSETLKDEIRKMISSYREMGWDLVKMYIRGASMHLKFGRTD
ncbi:MAG: hypothetical protein V3U73_02325 [bacterium]